MFAKPGRPASSALARALATHSPSRDRPFKLFAHSYLARGFGRSSLSQSLQTVFAENEDSAAGDHTVMSEGGHGLPHYTRNDRSIVDCDLVTWHTIGLTHAPRAEDWPVMPTEHAGILLLPSGFNERNPVLDLPEGNGTYAASAKL